MLFVALVGCDGNNASYEETEMNRKMANQNLEYNAKMFRAKHPEYANFTISTNADSTQTSKCPQGDGWATLKLVSIDNGVQIPIKCSTYSESIGCLSDAEMKQKETYASQDGHCNYEIPVPLPKIAN